MNDLDRVCRRASFERRRAATPPLTAGEGFGLVMLAVFVLLVGLLFTGAPSARQERAVAEGRRTVAEIHLREANNRAACNQGVVSACS